MIRALPAALGLLLLAGCSAQPPAPDAPQTPPRPREVPVLGLDPCTLMPAGPLADLRIEPTGRPNRPPAGAPPEARGCDWSRNVLDRPSAGVSIGLAPQNVADYLSQPDAVQSTVAGFPAVDLPNNLRGAQRSCVVRIDVAPGQALIVSYFNTSGDEVGATHELMCERAHRAADAVMQQLLTTRK